MVYFHGISERDIMVLNQQKKDGEITRDMCYVQ